MAKKDLGAKLGMYPMPTTLVGALVGGKPNYATIAHVGIMDLGHISLGMHKSHLTNSGIKVNKSFSVNLPSEAMVEVTDHCGLVSGNKEDKSKLFRTFYGKLKNAPMIEECPLNMECSLARVVDFPAHDIFIGKVEATYCDEKALSDGVPDYGKLRPILFSMTGMEGPSYWRLGEPLATAWSVGKGFKQGKARK
jgi:flavin reductase (DIM6/NTAB) family NADH-FMN oxidoreductase RutF